MMSKMINSKWLLITAIPLLLCDCAAPIDNQIKPVIKHNYIMLLDLSDRILNKDQIHRDKTLLKSAFEAFQARQKEQMYFSSTDEFKVLIAHQEDALRNTDLFALEDQLYYNLAAMPYNEKVNIRDSLTGFQHKIDLLYSKAKISEDWKDFKGADIQGYLKNRLQSDVPDTGKVENFLIILTDGYQYVQGRSNPIDKWPPVTDLSNINVMVLEMAPRLNKPDEQQTMTEAWTDWLENMNAKSIELVPQNALGKQRENMYDFLRIGSTISAPAIKSVEKEDQQATIIDTDQLPNGDYVALQDGKMRTLRLLAREANDDQTVFDCSLLQMGIDYHNLEGRIDSNTDLLDIDKLGVFGIKREDGGIKLVSNSQDLEFSLITKDQNL